MATSSLDARFIWNVGEMPFYLKCNDQPSNLQYGLPDHLPITLLQDAGTGLIFQKPEQATINALEESYMVGSVISGAMDDHGPGKSYADSFIEYLINNVVVEPKGKKVLEIGCGNGYLLSRLKEMGADVLGIEPGPQGQDGMRRFNLPIIRCFFPNSAIVEKFDYVIGYAVMEHINNPGQFINNIENVLKEDGRIILAVPDCEPHLISGDISCLLHEHFNYFTSATLRKTLQKHGFSGFCNHSDYGGVIYGCFSRHDSAMDFSQPELIDCSLTSFQKKSLSNSRIIADLIKSRQNEKISLGIYVPGRIVNLLYKIRNSVNVDIIRFFDDDPMIYHKYYPCFASKVENFGELDREPVDCLLIASHAFGGKIATKVENSCMSIEIIGWDRLFAV